MKKRGDETMQISKAFIVRISILFLNFLSQPVFAITFNYHTTANAWAEVGWFDSYFGLVGAYDNDAKEANNARSYATAYFDEETILGGDYVGISALADASIKPNELVLSAEVTGSYEQDIGWYLMEYFYQDANSTIEGILQIDEFPAGAPCSLQIDISFPNETWKARRAWKLYIESFSDFFVAGRDNQGDYGELSGTIDAYAGEEIYVFMGIADNGYADHDFEALGDGKLTINASLAAVKKFIAKAYGPIPADGSIYNDTSVSLEWWPGDTAASHDLYFGSSFDDVNDGINGTFQGNHTATSFIAGSGESAYPDDLVPDTTYYWRIDEVEADGRKHKGDIWSFRIAPKTAYDLNPADGEEFVETDVTLSWTAGLGAESHTVYFSDNFEDVNNAAKGSPQESTTYTPGILESRKFYYWRVDEYDGLATYKGEVWSFSTPGAVGSPNPYNGAVNVNQTTILTWIASDNAESHQVYFGTDEDAVRNATTSSPEYKGSKNLDDEKYDPGQLAMETTYYWRIDEIEGQNTQKGNVWTFTTADYLVVDDWEFYNDIDPPSPASNTIFAYWMDGYTNPNVNGALIGYDPPQPSYVELNVVHGGKQSMPYIYDIDGKYAEASLTLSSPRNWTASDVKTLTIWFHGDLVNDPAPIYVTIANTTGTPVTVTYEDPSATQIHAWTKWDIPLQTFADQGINLMDVDSIILGIGNKTNPPGGAGKVYFDDIGLHPLPES
jgi:hypothetical protein